MKKELILSEEEEKELDQLIGQCRVLWQKEEMTPLERLNTIWNGKEPDRVFISSVTIHGNALISLEGRKPVRLVYEEPLLALRVALKAVLEYELELYFPFMPIDMGLSQPWGTTFRYTDTALPSIQNRVITEGLQQFLDMEMPNPREFDQSQKAVASIKYLKRKVGDISPIINVILGPYFVYCSYLRGIEKAFKDIKDNPSLAIKAFDKLKDYIIDLANYSFEAGAHYVIMFDTLTGSWCTPPDWYEKFCFPYELEIIKRVKGPIILGVFEDCTDRIERYAETGSQLLLFGTPTDFLKAKELCKRKGIGLAYWGIKVGEMRNQTPDWIQEKAKELLKIGAPGGAFSLGFDSPSPDVPKENILAFSRAVRTYGKYPLNPL